MTRKQEKPRNLMTPGDFADEELELSTQEILRLRKENEMMRETLQRFADVSNWYWAELDTWEWSPEIRDCPHEYAQHLLNKLQE